MARPDEGARFLVRHMLTVAGEEPGIRVFVTHDSLVTATAARRTAPCRRLALAYLEGAFLWKDGWTVRYRE